MHSSELAALFARDLRRLRQELEAFPDTAALWAIGPGVTNAAGNLALHLEGNLREYIGRQLGGVDFARDRPREFNARGLPQAELVARLEAVAASIPPVNAALSEPAMDAPYPEDVLGAPMPTRQFLVHLLGHLNYHLGQIDYLRRLTTGAGAISLAGLPPLRGTKNEVQPTKNANEQ
jgi:hypothetical protein